MPPVGVPKKVMLMKEGPKRAVCMYSKSDIGRLVNPGR